MPFFYKIQEIIPLQKLSLNTLQCILQLNRRPGWIIPRRLLPHNLLNWGISLIIC